MLLFLIHLALSISQIGLVMLLSLSLFSLPPAADNGTMQFWDWRSGYCFQKLQSLAQPGSLDSETGIFASSFDMSGCRLITGEADKTIKIYKEDETAVSISVVKYVLCPILTASNSQFLNLTEFMNYSLHGAILMVFFSL